MVYLSKLYSLEGGFQPISCGGGGFFYFWEAFLGKEMWGKMFRGQKSSKGLITQGDFPFRKRSFILIAALLSLIPLFFFLAGCASTPVIKMSTPVPDIVKEYKSFKLGGSNADWIDSGIRVAEGDYLTIMAKGKMYPAGSFAIKLDPQDCVYFRIGIDGRLNTYGWWGMANTHRISTNGNIFLRLNKVAERGFGSFIVDLIVWNNEDPVQISNFLEKLSYKDPTNETLKETSQALKDKKKIILAEQKAKKEVEETEKAIGALKGKETLELKKTEGKGGAELDEKKLQEEANQAIQAVKEKEAIGIKDVQKERQVAELNEQLQKASQALADLEGMKKKLAEQEEKEKELRSRLKQSEDERLRVERMGGGIIPPMIAIASPKDGMTVDSEYIIFSGVAESGKGINKLEILLNQQIAKRKDQRALQLDGSDLRRIYFSERIRLQQGKNEISVVVQDDEGLATKRSIFIQFAKKKEEIWAVVIGINRYKRFPPLKYSVNDAQEFYRYLVDVNQVPQDHVWLLLDEDATLEKLRSTLGTQLRRYAGRDDMVIIYLAGHGTTERDASSPDGDGLEKYILPHNADPRDLYASAMPMSEVARIFNRISSERLVFISDTCYSGASGGRTVPVMGARGSVSGAFLDRLSQGRGRVILTASDANEVSVERDELQHGVFTFYLLEALKGKGDLDGNGIITFDEVYRYVSTKVPQATGQEQHPVKKGEMTGDIVLGIVR